ncbi:MAG: hypothetical protein JW821_18825 [Deltaproteobacteria bacterium]|nr:hypothetical protein [Deltaproteobacteria bacterium]
MFILQADNIELKLEVVPVVTLLHHEQVIPSVARKLLLQFKNWTNLQDPIIVDENHIILDGNHRAHVFRELNFRYIPVCKVDYFHEKSCLRYWFRMIGNARDPEEIHSIIEECRGNIEPVSGRDQLAKNMEEDCFLCGLQRRDSYALIRFARDAACDAVTVYDTIEKMQEKFLEKGLELSFIPCQYVQSDGFCRELKEDEIVLWTPRITKEMVVDAARQCRVFAPKTTRHLIPARPINVNVPTQWFRENISLKEINRRFESFLRKKGLKRFGPGQVINGRYYEEDIFVFFDKITETSEEEREYNE